MYLPLLVSAVLAVVAPWAGRRMPPRAMPPRAGAWAMVCAATVAAGTWVTELAILAFTATGQAALSATGGPVPQRVQALLAPPLRSPNGVMAAFAVLMAACYVSLAVTAHDTERLFEAAMHAHATATQLRTR
jgi:hypothetical protein